jgi:hypothetical protein
LGALYTVGKWLLLFSRPLLGCLLLGLVEKKVSFAESKSNGGREDAGDCKEL